MNTIVFILVSIIMGTVAGAVSALVVTDIKTEELSTIIHSIKENVGNLAEITHLQNDAVQESMNTVMAVNDALQRFIVKYGADKTWMTQSLNDLWNDYDERHQKTAETEPVTATESKKTRKPRKKKTEEVKESPADAD